jgi:cytochrome oxidase Cu insertion factor (SCO1/SenC/PrrC family)
LLALALLLHAGATPADGGHGEAAPPAPMEFVPPAPGSYELQRIMDAADGRVLDTDGSAHALSRYTGGKVTLLSFIYSSCADASGCPYAYMVFHQLQSRLERNPRLAGQVRLVSLSFDPARDTPEVLALYAGDNAGGGRAVEWAFLTTASMKDLLPILDGFGQDVFLDVDPASGKHLGTYSHVLKVFLIDRSRTVREIYTTAFLMPDMVYNDIVTLLLEAGHKLE